MPTKPQDTKTWCFPTNATRIVPIHPTVSETVTDETFANYQTFFAKMVEHKDEGKVYRATLHFTSGREVPVFQGSEQSELTGWRKLYLQDGDITREIIPQSCAELLVRKSLTSEEATEFQRKQCSCGKAGNKRCSRCHKQFYCGKECQEKDWINHRSWCGDQTRF